MSETAEASAPQAMRRYKVREMYFFEGSRHRPGAELTLPDGQTSDALEPLDLVDGPAVMIEKPVYRTRSPVSFGGGMITLEQREVQFDGWPLGPLNLEPLNESARRIAFYVQQYQHASGLPRQPFDRAAGRILLLARGQAGRLVQPAPEAETPNMPQWTADREVRTWHGAIKPGTPLTHIGWPALVGDMRVVAGSRERGNFELTPVNKSAEAVHKYWEQNAASRRLLETPWDFYTADLYLPKIGERRVNYKEQVNDRDWYSRKWAIEDAKRGDSMARENENADRLRAQDEPTSQRKNVARRSRRRVAKSKATETIS